MDAAPGSRGHRQNLRGPLPPRPRLEDFARGGVELPESGAPGRIITMAAFLMLGIIVARMLEKRIASEARLKLLATELERSNNETASSSAVIRRPGSTVAPSEVSRTKRYFPSGTMASGLRWSIPKRSSWTSGGFTTGRNFPGRESDWRPARGSWAAWRPHLGRVQARRGSHLPLYHPGPGHLPAKSGHGPKRNLNPRGLHGVCRLFGFHLDADTRAILPSGIATIG